MKNSKNKLMVLFKKINNKVIFVLKYANEVDQLLYRSMVDIYREAFVE